GHAGWAAYLERRERLWPAYAADVERALADLDAASALDRADGGADVLAGFALLELAVRPARVRAELGVHPVRLSATDPVAAGRDVEVRDPARAAAALDRIERGLS